ncbi:imidazole glycerol phosphate synthase subunit HisH [Buchananella hordeovulneris]|uniref:imidazole glycerol phosphate synthase subunit HisH n=1 Tax=Buchananella hordeovulneris TaxID=52770 RepID=UPI0026DACE54|nr:imidazole glycerol phosphate synthase subunit HisH [Buchananella hordeovulneris]MDO5080611.1 imidazole glycerol phosphate synthase subunit HisH [Buchananella hordeovulneris]
MQKVVVLSYGAGNVRSVCRALERAGAQVELTAEPRAVENAAGLVVPGVGAFGAVMAGLQAVDAPRLIERRLAGGRGVLGICVGLQVMFAASTEKVQGAPTPGLGQWDGLVDRLQADVVPHMGWSPVRSAPGSALFSGVENEMFYFVHSYAAHRDPAADLDPHGPTRLPLTTWATHGRDFVAAVENGPLAATQFHPEKSGPAGAQLLRNWLQTL